jgi:hypothetical protein
LVVRDFCFWAVWTAGPVLKKSLGLIMSNFWGLFFFMFLVSKKVLIYFEITIVSALISCIINYCYFFFLNETVYFKGCAHSQMWMYYIKVSYYRTGYLDWGHIPSFSFLLKR